MASRAPAPLLNLSTLVERPTVAIDGVAYDLLTPDSLPLLSCQRLHLVIPIIDELAPKLQSGTLSSDEEVDLAGAFERFCRIVLDAPEAVQAKLTPLHRLLIYRAFLQLPQPTLQLVGALATGATTSRSTGAKSSHVSPSVTRSTRRRGSSASRASSLAPTS